MESCPSGRRCSTRNAVSRKGPRVRIPNSPPSSSQAMYRLWRFFYKTLPIHLFSLGRAKLSGVLTINLLCKRPSHLFGITKPIDTLFLRKNSEKIQKYARHNWRAYFWYLKSFLFHINLQKSLILGESSSIIIMYYCIYLKVRAKNGL